MVFQNSYFSNRLFNTCFLLAIGMVGFSMPSQGYASILLDDSFSDNNRTGQTLPGSANWYSRQGTESVFIFENSLTFNLDGSSANGAPTNGVLSYFTNSGTPFVLATGQSITLSFDLTVNSELILSRLGNRLRFGLMDSKGSRVEADNSGFNNSIFNEYEGYWGTVTPSGINASPGHAQATSIGKRDQMNDNLVTTGAMTRLGTFGHDEIMEKTTYQFTLDVMKTDDTTNTITMTIDGSDWTNSFVQMDTSGTFISFDTAVISLHDLSHEANANFATSATIGNIRVSTSTVPEPTALAIWSLIGVALLMRRKTSRVSATSLIA